MTEERKQEIIEEQIGLLVKLNEECEPEQIILNCEIRRVDYSELGRQVLSFAK
ncbi:hypothetical protein [Sporosarcina limicola]|uniref:Uncharacterized protein n=1 Tax=Sporosarcina limicola TaxID=34101 RepID=A0A927MRK6_9BACL|nr:hypothetical protein [Sporosarcina limicola]MBE1556076.1 hypothetical protein [Sporosarcina limicola]